MPFDLPFHYLLGMSGWLAFLAVALPVLLDVRRRWLARHSGRTPPRRAPWANLGLSVWFFLAALTVVELYFAIIYDQSDAINETNVSKHWFKRHVEPDQKTLEFRDGRATPYRDERAFPKKLREGQRQICFIGDSFTFGHGVPRAADRFSDRVGASLDRQAPGRFVVSNLADAGRDLRWVELVLQEIVADQLPVHVVVYTVCLNDIETFDERTLSYFTRPRTKRLHSFLLDDTYFLNLLYCRTVVARAIRDNDYYALLQAAYSSATWGQMEIKFDDVRQLCGDHGIDLRIAIFPFLHNLGPDYPFARAHRLIVDYCHERGLPVLDLLPVLEPHAAEGLTVSPFDSHPNERAHQLAAEAMERELLADLFGKE
jgi:hypothetical protein